MQKNLFRGSGKRERTPVIVSPADGKIIPLSEVEDEVFSSGILGDGIAILPDSGEIWAPVDGVVSTVAETRHAVSITADCGAEILIHCGIDTVALRGEGFETYVSAGERVTPGKLLLKFDPARVLASGYAVTTPVVVVNASEFTLAITDATRVRRGDSLIRLTKK